MYKNALCALDAAILLGISLDELFDVVEAGKVPYYRGFHGHLGFMFFEDELREWKKNKLIRESGWIDQTLTTALYGTGKPSNLVDMVTVDVAENYFNLIEKQALLR